MACYRAVVACYRTVVACYRTEVTCYHTVVACYRTAVACYRTVVSCYRTVTSWLVTVTAVQWPHERAVTSMGKKRMPQLLTFCTPFLFCSLTLTLTLTSLAIARCLLVNEHGRASSISLDLWRYDMMILYLVFVLLPGNIVVIRTCDGRQKRNFS